MLKIEEKKATLPNALPNIKLLKLFSFTPVINTIFAVTVVIKFVYNCFLLKND